MAESRFHVAIIGGGLCGLALAIALTKRDISYTIYEARGSFTEIGAGLNLGPNSIPALDAIDPALREKVFALATRNEPGYEDVWMNIRFGAPTERFEDGALIKAIMAPPTGNMTLSRNELLQLLATSIRSGTAKFNKKIASLRQSDDSATMNFADGTQEYASVVVACDGAHSTVRRLMLGDDHPAAKPEFSHTGGYRAVFPMHVHEQAVGVDKAHSSQSLCGPDGYVINYPIDGGKNVNIGLWKRVREGWDVDNPWVLHDQKSQMLKDFELWGPTVQRIMSNMSEQTQFWATFHYATAPEHYFDGRVCLIGDAAHAMCPHQGQGATQAMEDVFVMAAVLSQVSSANQQRPGKDSTSTSMQSRIEAAFAAWEIVRRARFEAVAKTSVEAIDFWSDFLRADLTQEDVQKFDKAADKRFEWIWNADVEGQGERAVAEMKKRLYSIDAHMLEELNGHINSN